MTDTLDLLNQFSEMQDEATLENLVKKAEQLAEINEVIAEMEESVSNLKKHANHISQKELPEMMEELGMKTFELKDGSKLGIKDFINGSLPKDPMAFEDAIEWLVDHDLESIIKTDVSLKFGKGEENFAKNAVEMLKENGYEPEEKYGVHPMTLASSIKELYESGVDIPFEKLGLYKGRKAEIKLPKVKKK